jgi:hypothetical protein
MHSQFSAGAREDRQQMARFLIVETGLKCSSYSRLFDSPQKAPLFWPSEKTEMRRLPIQKVTNLPLSPVLEGTSVSIIRDDVFCLLETKKARNAEPSRLSCGETDPKKLPLKGIGF